MGRGDKRTRRGKISRGSFGKLRLKASKIRKMKAKKAPKAATKTAAKKKAAK